MAAAAATSLRLHQPSVAASSSILSIQSFQGLRKVEVTSRVFVVPLNGCSSRPSQIYVLSVRAGRAGASRGAPKGNAPRGKGTSIVKVDKKSAGKEEDVVKSLAGSFFSFGKKDEKAEEVPESKPTGGFFSFGRKAESEEAAPKSSFEASPVSLVPVSPFAGLQVFGRGRKADPGTVFVAGATGLTGSRIVLELLRQGFAVRAGVTDLGQAQKLVQIAAQYQVISREEATRLNVVEYSTKNVELSAKAFGNAGKIVVAVGDADAATSSGSGGGTGRTSFKDALCVVDAAILAKVPYLFVIADEQLVEDDAPGGFFMSFLSALGFGQRPSGLEQLLEKVVESEIKYVVARTGATEGQLDYGSLGSVVIVPEAQISSGAVSKMQIASMVAGALSNIELAENKVFGVTASATASSRPVADLLSAIPEDGRRAAKKAAKEKAEAEEKARLLCLEAEAEAKQVAAMAKAAAEAAAKLEAEAKAVAAEEARAATAAAQARAKADAATASVSGISASLKEVAEAVGAGRGLPGFGGISLPSAANFSFALPKVELPKVEVPIARAKAEKPLAAPAATRKVVAKAPKDEEPAAKAPAFSFPAFSFPQFGAAAASEERVVAKKAEPVKRVEAPKRAALAPVPRVAARAAPAAGAAAPKRRPTIRQVKEVSAPPPQKEAPPKPTEKRKAFGGIFQQEVVYADNDAGDF